MSEEEVENKYGDVPLTFSHYYKYVFTFTGVAEDGTKISAGFGGDSGDIYKSSVSSGDIETLQDFKDKFNEVNLNRNDKTIFYWNDY